ncbi:hypothetical protein [Martelella limonii]|uniref:hypothetical protein n=1 Tax=Martelella limonii TaxID=1647649 RepID=UPI001580CE33|nr:hypothetical protein [Martelella limonii]
MNQVRVNVKTLANVKAARKEKRNGRDVVIVPSATLPDNIVMNSIMYPAEEIAKSFTGLERTPAPLGHPIINGKLVSARDPEGINIGHIGAWNERVRQENGRVLLDKVIDVEVANRSEGGKAVLKAIEDGGPIHTSTGLLARMETVTNEKGYSKIARDMVWDHDAILLNQEGAATPDQGVGMLVNANGKQEEINVINSSIEDDADRDMNWAVESLARALDRKQKAGALERMKTAILEAIGLSEREPSANRKEADMADEKQLGELSAKVDALSEAIGKIGDTVGTAVANAVKPIVDAQNEMVANQKAKDDAELGELREKIVKANLMDEDGAKELTLNLARSLSKTIKNDKAAPLRSGFNGGNDKPTFKLPASEKKEA